MSDARSASRLNELARAAHVAEMLGEDAVAGEAWRAYRLVRDASRDPEALLAEGIALSLSAMELAPTASIHR